MSKAYRLHHSLNPLITHEFGVDLVLELNSFKQVLILLCHDSTVLMILRHYFKYTVLITSFNR